MSRYETRSGTGPSWTEPPTVLVLAEGHRDRTLLAERLGSDYVVTLGAPDGDWGAFDCVVVDDRTFHRVVDDLAVRRVAAEPVFLPVLVLAGSENRAERLLTAPDADHVDDVVVAPTRGPLLRKRMASLLRTRALSLDIDEERDQYRALAESAEDAIVVFDEVGTVQYANPAVESVFGQPPEAVVDRAVTDLLVGNDLSELAVTRAAGESLVGRHADDRRFPVEVSVAAFEREEERWFTAIVRDVSDREAREQELARSRDLLDKTQSIADVGGWEVNLETGDLTWTDEAYRIHGLPVGTEVTLGEALSLYHTEDTETIREALTAPIPTGEQFDLDLRIQRPDGADRWIRAVGHAIEEDGDRLVRGAVQDITERVEREREVQRSRERLELALGSSNAGVWEWTPEPDEIYLDESTERLLGLDPDTYEPTLEVLSDLVHPDDMAPTVAAIDRAVETGESFTTEFRVELVEGELRWLQIYGRLVDGTATEPRRCVGIVVDVTERVERERELEHTVDLLDETQEIASVGGWEIDLSTGELTGTRQAYEIYGLPTDASLDYQDVIERFHPDDTDDAFAALSAASTAGEPFDLELRLVVDSETRWVRVKGNPADTEGETVVRGTVQDITERKRRERELGRSHAMLDQTQSIGAIGGWELDLETEALVFTDETFRLHDRPVGDVPSLDEAFDDYHPDDVPRLREAVERAIDDGTPYDLECRLVTAEGRERWVRVQGVRETTDDGGQVLRGTLQDITDRKEREQTLEENRKRLELALDASGAGIWEWDLESDEIDWDESLERMFGLEPGTFEGTFDEVARYIADDVLEAIMAEIESALETGGSFQNDIPIERPDGERRWHSSYGQVLTDEAGNPTTVIGVDLDVTDRKEREQELERTVDLLDKTQSIADVGGWELDVESGDLLFTEETYRIHDVPVGEQLDLEAAFGFYHPEDEPRVRAAVERAVEDGAPYDLECRLVTAEDRERWVRIQGLPEGTPDRSIIRGTIQDVTDRKEREQELERTVDLLDKTQTTASVGGWEIDPETDTVFWTREVFDIVGLPVGEEPTLEEAFDRYHPDDRPAIADAVDAAVTSLVPIDEELRIVRPSGEVRWVRVLGSPEVVDGEVVTLRGAFQDVTEQKRQARELERSERRFRAVFEGATDAMVIANDDGEYVTANPAAAELFGVEETGDLLGRTIVEFAPEDFDFGSEWERFHRGENITGEFPLVRPDGTQLTTQFAATPNVLPGRHLSVLRDVTERKRREEDLERYETIVRTAADPIYALDGEGRFTLVNEAFAATTGRTVEDLIGTPVADFVSRADFAANVAHVRELVAGEDPEPVLTQLETPSGPRQYELNVAVVGSPPDDGLPATVGVARDVTDLHQREQRLSVLDRVLRHNIRNRLNVVMGYASTLAHDDNATVRASATTIVEASQELLDLSETARRFESAILPHGEQGEPLDLAVHLPDVVEDANAAHPEAGVVLTLPDVEALWVEAHEALELALEEVVGNAITHCDRTPEVTVSVEQTGADTVEVRVADNGPGIEATERGALERDTETPLEHMSGLGLWFVRWTVEASGGTVAIEDNDPRGTVVVFELPTCDGPAHETHS